MSRERNKVEGIRNLSDAGNYFKAELRKRGKEIVKAERVVADRGPGFPIYHERIWTRHNEVQELYHVKFAKQGYRLKPTDKLSPRAKELDEKLRFALSQFGQGNEELNGLNEDVVLDLLNYTEQGLDVYYITVMAQGTVYAATIQEFYNFVMRYDTFFKFPRSNVPICEVPVGWMKKWTQVLTAPPSLSEHVMPEQKEGRR